MYKKDTLQYLLYFMIVDVLCLIDSFYLITGGVNFYKQETLRPLWGYFLFTCLIVDLIILFLQYEKIFGKGKGNLILLITRKLIYLYIVFSIYLLITKTGNSFSRIVLFGTLSLYYILDLIFSILTFYVVQNKFQKTRRVLVIVKKDRIERVIGKLKNFNITIVAILCPDIEEETFIQDIKCINIKNIDTLSKEWITEAFVDIIEIDKFLKNYINDLRGMGITIHKKIDDYSNRYSKQFIETLFGEVVLTSTINYMSFTDVFLKRLMDIFIGIIGFIIMIIIMIIFGPIIYIKSRGNIFFTQNRVGENGKIFKMFKFRTMKLHAEDEKELLVKENNLEDQMMFKLEFDPRVIGNYIDENGNKHKGIGQFMRDLSLDEFPQFINVLKGDMSVVGTRPPTLDEWKKYDKHHRIRMAMKPGVTGAWQIAGRSNITDFEEVVKLDIDYIQNWSLKKDIKMILKTIKVVLKKEGAH